MKRSMKIIGLLVLILTTGILLSRTIHPARALPDGDPDRTAMEKTVRQYLDLKRESRFYDFNGDQLAKVLANDPRGGILQDEMLQAVRYMKGNSWLRADQIGMLDYYQSLYAYYHEITKLYDDAVNTGRLVVPTRRPPDDFDKQRTAFDRRTPTPPGPYDDHDYNLLYTIPEIQKLTHGTGLYPAFQFPRPASPNSRQVKFTFQSVTIHGDLAVAKVDYEYGLFENVFVKKDGNWYLVGEKVLVWHEG